METDMPTMTATTHHITSVENAGSLWIFCVKSEDGQSSFYADHRMGRDLCAGLVSEVLNALAEADVEIPDCVLPYEGAVLQCADLELDPSDNLGMEMPVVHFSGVNLERFTALVAKIKNRMESDR